MKKRESDLTDFDVTRVPDDQIQRTGHPERINPDDIVAEYHSPVGKVYILNTWIKQQTPETLQEVQKNIDRVCNQILRNSIA